MAILDKIKKYVPKTPKQWAIAGLGTTAAALTADYAWRKDGSLVMQLWHKVHHGGGGGGHPHAHARAHHGVPHPGVMPQMQTSTMMYGGPQMSAVFVEPTPASTFAYEFRNHGYGHPHFGGQAHHAHYPQHPHATAPLYDPYAMHPQQHHHAHHAQPPLYPQPPLHPQHAHDLHDPNAHFVGAPSDEPHAPKQAKAKVPPPGAYGIVSGTPQAAGIVAGDFSEAAPCGPGLFYDVTQQRCVPVPSTPPYGWQER